MDTYENPESYTYDEKTYTATIKFIDKEPLVISGLYNFKPEYKMPTPWHHIDENNNIYVCWCRFSSSLNQLLCGLPQCTQFEFDSWCAQTPVAGRLITFNDIMIHAWNMTLKE